MRQRVLRYPQSQNVAKWILAVSVAGGFVVQTKTRRRQTSSEDTSTPPSYVSHCAPSETATIFPRVSIPVVPPTSTTNMLSPTLPVRIIRPNPNLEIAFDVRTRNAVYVMEKLDRQGQNLGKGHKRPHFYEERGIVQEAYRSKLSHYKHSGLDRGHLAPAADFPLQTQDTYTLCNISPQNHNMNLSIWSQLEDYCRRVADRQDDQRQDTYVVTGPIWLPMKQVAVAKFQYAHLGLGQPPSLVSIPTHFFKVVAVVCRKTKEIVEFACFVVPNMDPHKSKGMQDYVVSWTDLETVTGLQFFPSLVTDEWKEWADHITHETVLKLRNTQHQPLLLTDGKPGTSKRRKGKGHTTALVLLCKGGQCQ